MAPTDRNRPRRTVTLDPAVDAFLGQDEVNAGRLIDQLIKSNVADRKLREAAEDDGVLHNSDLYLGQHHEEDL